MSTPTKEEERCFFENDANVVKTTNLNFSSNGKVCAFGLLHEHQSFKNLSILDMVAMTHFVKDVLLENIIIHLTRLIL
jgi:hypothetical protein